VEGGAIQLSGRYFFRRKERGEKEELFFTLSSLPRLARSRAPAMGEGDVVVRGLEEGVFLGGGRGVDSVDAYGRPYLLCSADSAAE
jgi:hypothetical protein